VIGKEGRNVRTFERMTGVDVLIDDTPGYITLSSFDPIRREIARVALEALMRDGRIQPAKIEEEVEKARREVSTTIRKMGEKACYDANVPNLDPDLVTILGRLHFRTSYGQNVLWHSVEMANIAAIIAEEVGADIATARAGALLHDIGKTVSHEVQGTHVEIGIRILQKYGVGENVILAMCAHHEEYPYETPESIIVQIADSLLRRYLSYCFRFMFLTRLFLRFCPTFLAVIMRVIPQSYLFSIREAFNFSSLLLP
jgi:ribonuclease Y